MSLFSTSPQLAITTATYPTTYTDDLLVEHNKKYISAISEPPLLPLEPSNDLMFKLFNSHEIDTNPSIVSSSDESDNAFKVLTESSVPVSFAHTASLCSDYCSKSTCVYRGGTRVALASGSGSGRRLKGHSKDVKALSKEERHRMVKEGASNSDRLSRTVHLRFLPTCMKQSELANICKECGEYWRVRICGNAMNNQNWIYGFIEFATVEGANRMMRMSGMELYNGPGRPALRLKCNAAKQPIVDCVFHDADVTTNTACIFGLGNFANRTLKDALDSYFNLKAKEAQQPTPYTDLEQGGTSGTGLRSHTKAFCPNPSATAFFPSCIQETTVGASSSSLHTISEHESSDSAPGITLCGGALPTSTATETHFSPFNSSKVAQKYLQYDDGVSADLHTQWPVMEFPFPSQLPDAAMFHFADGNTAGTSNASDAVSSQGASLKTAACAGGHYQCASSLLLTPRLPFDIPSCLHSSDYAALPLSAISKSDPVSQYPVPLKPTLFPHLSLDGSEVLKRGRKIALRSLQQACACVSTQRDFYDAIGSLQSLLDLLDRHTFLTGGAADTGSGDAGSELPQRVTQLRLFAHLTLALLYLSRRDFSKAMRCIHAIVATCSLIPKTRPRQPFVENAPAIDRHGALIGEATSAMTSQKEAALCSPIGCHWGALGEEGGVSAGQEGCAPDAMRKTLCVKGKHPSSASSSGNKFSFFMDESDDLLHGIFSSLLEDTGKEAADERGRGTNGWFSPWNKPSVDLTADAEMLYRRDGAFQAYVLNVLVAVGLGMEDVQPLITHSTYTLAAGRAREVLGMNCAALDACLQNSCMMPAALQGLRTSVLRELHGNGNITALPHLFFTSIEGNMLKALQDKRSFWDMLPPLHCVRCFSC